MVIRWRKLAKMLIWMIPRSDSQWAANVCLLVAAGVETVIRCEFSLLPEPLDGFAIICTRFVPTTNLSSWKSPKKKICGGFADEIPDAFSRVIPGIIFGTKKNPDCGNGRISPEDVSSFQICMQWPAESSLVSMASVPSWSPLPEQYLTVWPAVLSLGADSRIGFSQNRVLWIEETNPEHLEWRSSLLHIQVEEGICNGQQNSASTLGSDSLEPLLEQNLIVWPAACSVLYGQRGF